MAVFDFCRVRCAINDVISRGGRPRKLKLSPDQFEAFKRWSPAQISYPAWTNETMLLGLRVVEDRGLPEGTLIVF